MQVRQATVLDSSFILSMLVKMHEESEFKLGPIDPKKFSQSVLSVINDGICFVAIDDDKFLGSIGGVYSSEWWTNETILGDIWFYVHKEHRNTTAAIELMKKFIEAGDGMNIKLGHVYNGDLDRKDKFYERLGLVKAGSTYIKEKQ
jgi:GNAT superfamily N-acetyltransferase